jgi:type VI secretion system secreted protein Hcp
MKKALVCIAGLTVMFFSSVGMAHDPAYDEDDYLYQEDAAILSSAVNILLKIDGVEGESKLSGYESEIVVLSWRWGMVQSATMHVGAGGGAGKAKVEDLSLTKYVDKASPDLMRSCLSGAYYKEAILRVLKSGETPMDYIAIKMSDVLVSSVSTGGSGSKNRMTENVTLNFGKVQFSYTPQKEDGSADARVDLTWNIEANVEE